MAGSFQNLILRVGADVSALKQQLYRARTEIAGFNKYVQGQMSQVGAALAGGVITLGVGQAIQDAVKVEGALEQVKRLMGESADEFIAFSKTTSEALGMSKSEALDYGRTYANLTSIFTKSTEETMKTTVELMEASAIVSSATGRTMEDVMFRIRSGLLGNTEAVEDLGVTVYINMIEASDAMKKFANGKSWNQLDFRLQQQIRHYAILEQVQKKFGDEVFKNTGFRINQFSASLKDLRLALGDAFLPIVNVVLPYLTAFTRKLTEGMAFVAEFSRALFGVTKAQASIKTVSNAGNTIKQTGDEAANSAKKMKGFLAGFDEINNIPEPEASDTAVTDMSKGMGDPQMNNPFVDGMEEVKTKATDMGLAVRNVFTGMKDTITQNSDIIVATLSGLGAAFGTAMLAIGGSKLAANMPAIIGGVRTAITGLGAALGVITGPIGLTVLAIGALTSAFVYLYQSNDDFVNFVNTSLATAWTAIQKAALWTMENVFIPFTEHVDLMLKALKPLTDAIGVALVDAFNFFGEIAKIVWEDVLQPLFQMFGDLFTPASEAFTASLSGLFKIVESLGNIFKWVTLIVVGFISLIGAGILTAIKPVGTYLKTVFMVIFNNLGSTIKESIGGIKTTLKGVLDFITGVFTGNWRKAFYALGDILKGAFTSMNALVKFPMNLIIEGLNAIIEGLNSIKIDIPSWVPMYGGTKIGSNIPKIPKLARGGIVNSPTMAMVGEAGPEMIVPLENTSFVDRLASALGTAVNSAMQMNNTGNRTDNRDVVIKIDGNVLARAINPYTTKEASRVGTSILSIS